MASLISIRMVCYCPAHSASYWICICAALDTDTHAHRPQALIHLLPSLSTNDAIFIFIVLLIHKIHFSNQITVLRPNDITECVFFFCRGQDKNKPNQAPTTEVKTIFHISTTEEGESL